MANQHKHPVRGIRGIDDERTAAFDQAAKQVGSDRSAITGQLWDWFAGQPDAELPERPKDAK